MQRAERGIPMLHRLSARLSETDWVRRPAGRSSVCSSWRHPRLHLAALPRRRRAHSLVSPLDRPVVAALCRRVDALRYRCHLRHLLLHHIRTGRILLCCRRWFVDGNDRLRCGCSRLIHLFGPRLSRWLLSSLGRRLSVIVHVFLVPATFPLTREALCLDWTPVYSTTLGTMRSSTFELSMLSLWTTQTLWRPTYHADQ